VGADADVPDFFQLFHGAPVPGRHCGTVPARPSCRGVPSPGDGPGLPKRPRRAGTRMKEGNIVICNGNVKGKAGRGAAC
jgi:hypothetical protein